MASDPEAYSLELLPGPTAKKREFLGATIWMIAAAVLLVGLLGVKAYATKTEMAELETRRASYKRQEKRVKDLDRATESLLAQADELGRRARELQAVAGTGEQLARTLQSLDQRLPAEFWVEKVESHVGSDAELGVDSDSERPQQRIEGRARDRAASPTAQAEEPEERQKRPEYGPLVQSAQGTRKAPERIRRGPRTYSRGGEGA